MYTITQLCPAHVPLLEFLVHDVAAAWRMVASSVGLTNLVKQTFTFSTSVVLKLIERYIVVHVHSLSKYSHLDGLRF